MNDGRGGSRGKAAIARPPAWTGSDYARSHAFSLADLNSDPMETPMESPNGSETPWKRDEHARFVQALETYGGDKSGDEWKKITAFVQTRSLEDVRLHGRRYLQHLMQQQQLQQHQHLQLARSTSPSGKGALMYGVDPLQYPLTASRELLTQAGNNQNDPNGPNHAMYGSTLKGTKAKVVKTKLGNPKPGVGIPTSTSRSTVVNTLSSAAHSVASAMNLQSNPSPSQLLRQDQGGAVLGLQSLADQQQHTKKNVRRQKVWSFQDDKVLETALAAWTTGKPYSWPKIAASLPGKTAKDVRTRYEQLVADVTTIDHGGIPRHSSESPQTDSPTPQAAPARPPTHSSGLSSRIAPPPPIEVPPLGKGKLGSHLDSPAGCIPSSVRGTHGTRANNSTVNYTGTSMLSPTFLDFLSAEDKQPMAFAGVTDLPSPLLPSPTIPRSLSAASNNSTSSGLMTGTGTSSLLLPSPIGSGGLDLSTPRRRQTPKPGSSTTPRIWHDFLSDDFKFDMRSTSGRVDSGSENKQCVRESDHDKTDGKMSDRSNSPHCTE